MPTNPPRERLNRDRVLRRAVELADEIGVDAVTMRRLADELGVVPMALYKHVENRDALIEGMVDAIIREIPAAPPLDDLDWRGALTARIHAARRTLQRHPWARAAIESRTVKTPAVLDYLESVTAILLEAGFSPDLAHHALHAIGGRVWGFTQELFDDPSAPPAPAPPPEVAAALAARYPSILAVASPHGPDVVGHGCDDDAEFDFALELLLDGLRRRHVEGWSSRADDE